jgi:hypothetical protein
MKNVFLWNVAVEGAKMAVNLVWSGSDGLAGSGNTDRNMSVVADERLANETECKEYCPYGNGFLG